MLIRKSILMMTLVLSPALASAGEGGNSGGGGGNVPRNPVSSAAIKNGIYQLLVNESNRSILNYFFINMKNEIEETRSERRSANEKELYAKLFLGKKTIFQAINSLKFTDVQINENGPCLANSQPRDASVLDAHTGKICVSAYRLKNKIDESRLQIELYGILAHELSHIAGVEDENLAQFVHKDMRTRQSFVNGVSAFQLRLNSDGWLESLQTMKNNILSTSAYISSKEFYDEADLLNSRLSELSMLSEQWNMRMTELDEKASTTYGALQEKAKLFAHYIFVDRADVSKLVPDLEGKNYFVHDVRYGGANDNSEHTLRSVVYVPAKGDKKTMLLAINSMISDAKAIQRQIDMYLAAPLR